MVFDIKHPQFFLPICLTCYKLITKIDVEIEDEKLNLKYKCHCINTHKVVFDDYYYGLHIITNFRHYRLSLDPRMSGYYIQCNGKAFTGVKSDSV